MSLVFSRTVRFIIITRCTLTTSVFIAATALTLGACGSSGPQTPATTPTAEATTTAPTQSATPTSAPTIPGYHPGEIPPIPLFSVPAIDVLASSADKAVIQTASSSLTSVPGVTVSPAKCDGMSLVSGSTALGGDGSAISSSGKGTVVNDGTGSGVITGGPISIIYSDDGSGTYSNTDTMVTITVEADGSGIYSTTTTSIILDGNGGGNYSNANSTESTINNGDGPGQFSKGTIMIVNSDDGTGSYSDEKLAIQNDGNDTTTVNGVAVDSAPKAEKVSKLGRLPAAESLKPVESCDTIITLEDGVLFDFDKSDIRPEVAQTLKNLAGVLNNAEVPTTHICNHAGSISDEAFNLQLPQERADAVSAELKKGGVSAVLDTTGYGESKPVAPNENADSSGNPTNRALNRRVKIFIPAF